MTEEEFKKVQPGKTILKVKTHEGDKTMLVKFFLCDIEGFNGYWMLCTEDLSNPYPREIKEEDWDVYTNDAEIISF